MKYIIAAAFLVATPAGAFTVEYPVDKCVEIVSQEYSTGGGGTSFHMLEILCKDAEGRYTGFITSFGSAAGFFGFGRFDYPDSITYKPYSGDKLKITK